jgi:hypothetical protein
MNLDAAEIESNWQATWLGELPISDRLRAALPDRHIRLHSLSDSKQYPDDEAELKIVMTRHQQVIDALRETSANRDSLLWTIGSRIYSPTGAFTVVGDDTHLGTFINTNEWKSVPDPENESGAPATEEVWIRFEAGAIDADDEHLVRILSAVANEELVDVVVRVPGFPWLYCPYAGGADVFATGAGVVDLIATKFAAWRPKLGMPYAPDFGQSGS